MKYPSLPVPGLYGIRDKHCWCWSNNEGKTIYQCLWRLLVWNFQQQKNDCGCSAFVVASYWMGARVQECHSAKSVTCLTMINSFIILDGFWTQCRLDPIQLELKWYGTFFNSTQLWLMYGFDDWTGGDLVGGALWIYYDTERDALSTEVGELWDIRSLHYHASLN